MTIRSYICLNQRIFLDYCARVLSIYNQIKRYEEKMEETHVVKKIINLLQKKFHYVVVVIKKSQNIDLHTIQSFMGKLQAHEEIVDET